MAKADAVCASSDKKLQAAFREELPADGQATPKQMQAVLKRVVPIVEDTVAGLNKLEPPERLEGRFDAALDEAETAISSLRKGSRSARAAEAVFSAETDPFARTNEGLESVGVTACSQGGGGQEGAAGGEDTAGGERAAGTSLGSTFVATEYQFAGASTLKQGQVTIALSNRGFERHELNIVRLKDGVTAKQVMEAEAAGLDTEDLVADEGVGAVSPVDPGATGTVQVNLVPGTYAYACFLDAPDGQAHVRKGMIGQFQVA